MARQCWLRPILLATGLLLMVVCGEAARAEDAVVVGPPVPAAGGAQPPKNDASGSDSGAPARNFNSTRNVEDKVREQRRRRNGLFDFGIRDALLRLDDRIYEATHLRLAASYTMLYQHAYAGDGPRDAAGGDFDLVGTWEVIRRGGKTTGALVGELEGRHRLGTVIPPAGLVTTIDSLWTTTSGFNVQDFALIQFYWRQDLLNDRLRLRFGKLSSYSTFFGNRLNSSSLFFVNFAFSDNPAVFMPGNGLGLHATWNFSPRWSASFGIQNANAVKTEIDPSTVRHGEYWYALQAQYRATIRGLGEGTYRVGTWYTAPRQTADTPAGGGGVLSIDQELGKKLIGFVRYEYQGQNLLNPEVERAALTGTMMALRGGVGISSLIPAFPDDYMGIALAWGTPADSPLGESRARDSVVAEIFYRLQLESASQLSLSLQVIRSSTIYDQVAVLSVRYRLEF